MKILFSLCFFSLCSISWTQSNLSVFNNNGQQFYVILNGIRQNSIAQTNVQISQIKNGNYAIKIIFADGKTPDIDKNLMIDAPYDITSRVIFKKGKGKLQFMGAVPTQGQLQEAVLYRPNDAAIYSDAINQNINSGNNQLDIHIEDNSASVVNSTNTNVQTTISSSSTTTNQTIPDENLNLNMNVSLGGVNLNINTNASATGMESNTTFNQTTISNSTINTSTNTASNTINSNTNINNLTVSHQRINCVQTFYRRDAFIKELEDLSFEDDRIEALKLEMKSTCLQSKEAEDLLDMFSFDENKLEIAKYLSDRLLDYQNAGSLAKKLTFDSNKMEYRRYISE